MAQPLDIIPVDQFVAGRQPEVAPTQEVMSPTSEVVNSPDVIPMDQFVSRDAKYGTTSQMAKTIGEGALQGALGPVGTAIAIGYGSDPNEMRKRAEASPWAHGLSEAGGFIGSFGVGAGVGPVTSALGKGAEALSGAGKVFGGGTRLGVELSALTAGNEISKMMTNDPDQSIGSAATNIGMSALIGFGGGVALGGTGALWNATAGKRVGQFIEDFKGRLKYHVENPNPTELLGKELEDHYQAVKSMADEVYGASGIKAQDISKAVPETNFKIAEQASGLIGQIDNIIAQAEKESSIYGSGGRISALRGYRDRLKQALGISQDEAYEVSRSELSSRLSKLEPPEAPLNKVVERQKAKLIAPEADKKLLSLQAELEKMPVEKEIAEAHQKQMSGHHAPNAKERLDANKSWFKVLEREQELKGKIALREAELKLHNEAIESVINEEQSKTLEKFNEKVASTNKQAASTKKQLEELTPPQPLSNKSSADIYQALDQFKKDIGPLKNWSKLESFTEQPSSKLVGDVYNKMMTALEDTGVWGKAAERQKAINKAFHEFLPSLKDFEKRFTSEVGGQRVIDPGKISTYVNQLGKPNAELKQEMLENFLNASGKYKSVVDQSHHNLGLAAPEWNSSLSMAKESLKKVPGGAKLADALVKRSLDKFGGRALGAAAGYGAGKLLGLGELGAIIGSHTLGPVLETILPALVKPILENISNPEGLKGAVDYGMHVIKGERILNNAAKNVFKPGSAILPENLMPTEKTLEKLDKSLRAAQNDPQMLFNAGSGQAHYLPTHTASIAASAMRTVEMLNKMRPDINPQFPLDDERHPDRIELAKYKRALTIAEQPAVVLASVADGSLTPGDVGVLQALHPGAYANMKNKLISAMTEHVANGELIPFKTQMSLSVFLGQPLTEALRPINMVSNQLVGKQQEQGQEAPGPEGARNAPKGQKAALQKLSGMYNTPIQAREREKNSA